MASPTDLDRLLDSGGLGHLIDARISVEPSASRNESDLVDVALTRLQLGPEDVVMIGDSPYDIAAANRAGVRAVGLRCGGWSDRWLSGALAIYDHPADLLEHYDESPLTHGVSRGR